MTKFWQTMGRGFLVVGDAMAVMLMIIGIIFLAMSPLMIVSATESFHWLWLYVIPFLVFVYYMGKDD